MTLARSICIAVLCATAALGLASLAAGSSDACLLALANDRPGPICGLGVRLRYWP